MRSFIAIALLLAALPLALPAVADDSCLPTCEVRSDTFVGFVPYVTVVESGSWVTWTSRDIGHTASDDDLSTLCFNAVFTRSAPGHAYFEISDGSLYAMADGDEASPLTRCDGDSVTAFPDGSFAIDYVCLYHNRMTGTLLVR